MMKRNLIFGIAVTACLAAAGYYAYDRAQGRKALIEAEEEVTAPGEFSFKKLRQKAQAMAATPYQKPAELPSGKFRGLDYDEYRDIRFKPADGPWAKNKLKFDLQLFHVGGMFTAPVAVNEIIDRKAVPLTYHPEFFDYGKNEISPKDFEEVRGGGYAGFRLHYPLNSLTYLDEVVSFLGASYFRALGQGHKYGLSARGLAIDTASMKGEEFPAFTEFYIQKPRRNAREIKIFAVLDSPSAAGIYTFVITPGENTVMDVDAKIFPRKEINKLGIAPLTSMYLFGENTKNKFDDHRPEVHDSDGLLVLNGNGEWLWRPLDNSKYLRISAFVDENPKGFGLLQRDRDPAHYLDFEANYEQRPSAWVEPVGDWGKGWIELVEIPSQQEIHDNVVAYWVPKEKAVPQKELHYRYRLYWFTKLPVKKVPGDITATYTGIGGVSSMLEDHKRKFVIDFDILNMQKEVEKGIATLEVSASEGEITGKHLMYNPVTKGLTAYIDFKPNGMVLNKQQLSAPNGKTSELRASVVKKGKNISEIWSYQWLP